MKGIVFTEFLGMIEEQYGSNMVDDVIDQCDLESGGAYTTAGLYPHTELLSLVMALAQRAGLTARDVVYRYGHYLFKRFFILMPQFFEKPTSSFEFLESVHDTIHIEVKKLYPEAQLPHFLTQREAPGRLTMVYTSRCPFADLAEGLIQGCIDHYKEKVIVTGEDRNQKGQYCRHFSLVSEG